MEAPRRCSVSSSAASDARGRVASARYPTQEFASFTAILDAFARDVGPPLDVEAAAVGVAGPVVDSGARLTNIAWDVTADEIGRRLDTAPASAC